MSKHIFWAIGSAASFWVPIIAIFAVQHSNTNVAIANFVALLGFSLCWVVRRSVRPPGRQSIWMLIGLYLLGPILLSVATTFANGGFRQIHGWADVRWLLFACVFPPYQFLLAAMSGLWPSLLIVTVFLACTSAIERKQATV